MLFPLIVTLLFVAACFPLIALPLRRQTDATVGTATGGQEAVTPSAYEATLLALRDLEFDHELGVVTEDDYVRLQASLMSDAAYALETDQKQEQVAATGIEEAVRALRERRQHDRDHMRYCPQCGTSVASSDRFCSGCGASLAQ